VGRWGADEDEALREAVRRRGARNWVAVAGDVQVYIIYVIFYITYGIYNMVRRCGGGGRATGRQWWGTCRRGGVGLYCVPHNEYYRICY
jgi:hypothetical protein